MIKLTNNVNFSLNNRKSKIVKYEFEKNKKKNKKN